MDMNIVYCEIVSILHDMVVVTDGDCGHAEELGGVRNLICARCLMAVTCCI